MQTANQMRLGGRTDLARPQPLAQRPLSASRVARSARQPVLAAAKRDVLPAAVVLGANATAAGSAFADTVVPKGSGIPVSDALPTVSSGSVGSVDAAVNTIIDAIKAAGDVVQQGLDVAGVGAQYAKEAADVASPYVKSAVETVSPYAKTAVDSVREIAGPALRSAQPQLQSSLTDAQRLLQQQGLDINAAAGASQQASAQASGLFNQVRPLLSRVAEFVGSTEPTVLAEYGLGAVALYYLAPPVLGVIGGGLRGYAGTVSPPAALDLVSTRPNTFILDLRSGREKENGGALDIPGNNRLIELEYVSLQDRKLRSQLRNVSRLELLVTVEQIAALKKVGKGSTLLLLDSNGGASRAVAKALNAKGFRCAFVVQSGFNGWTRNRLRVKPSSSVSRVEVLSPAALISNSSNRSTRPSAARTVRAQRALPSGR